jgi:predicted HTH domain antitoxin
VSTITVKLEVPAEFSKFGLTPERIQKDAPTLLVLQLFKDKVISGGKAAELLSISRVDFLDLLGSHRLPIFDMAEEELARDLATASEFASRIESERYRAQVLQTKRTSRESKSLDDESGALT